MNKFRSPISPTLIFAAALIALVWGATEMKVRGQRAEQDADTQSDLANLSLLFQQDVLRTVNNLDRIIKFLRRSYEHDGYRADWPSLVREDFTLDSQTAQIAVTDATGRMITSSAMPHPKMPVDLSDRDHYKVQRDATNDFLFISQPIVGRASGKLSVQFTRRYTDEEGKFAGIIIISLDPAALVSTYNSLQVPSQTGFALVGADNIIRASSGATAKSVGLAFERGVSESVLPAKDPNLKIAREWSQGRSRLVASRPVDGTSLSVVVTTADESARAGAQIMKYYVFAALVTGIIVALALLSVRRDRLHMTRITFLASNDPLTKLGNRRSFLDELDRLVAERPSRPFLLHLIDLDHFKTINDTFGHPTGDKLLCAAAARLRKAVRPPDKVYRLGGDEFAIVQMGTSTEGAARALAGRICSLLAQPFEIGDNTHSIGATVGVSAPSDDLKDRVSLLKAADVALYLAKNEGRGQYRLYNAEINEALTRRRQMESELRDAIANDQLEVHYQPKVRLDERAEPFGYEALVRWRHPSRGLIAPSEFIPLAEETGAIVELGQWVLIRACRDVVASGQDVCVSVNVSAVQFKCGSIVDAVSRALEDSHLPAQQLVIEITESMLMHNHAITQQQLRDLRARGVRIALDDFGTGYSSLSYLEHYPIDMLKIDRSFVSKLGVLPRAGAIVRAVVALAQELDMVTVAEGVETVEQAEILRQLGCSAAQGYLFGKPQPAAVVWPATHRSAA